MANFVSTVNGKRFVSKGDRVTFKYDDPHKSDNLQVRVGTVDCIKGNAIVLRDDDRDGAFRSFSGAFVSQLVTL